MKFNFKKISAVTTSLLLTGMTMGVAAAASFPAPFVASGSADAAIVYGAGASLDLGQVTNIDTYLRTKITATGTGTPTGEGDIFQFDKSSTKYHLGDNITEVVSAALTSEKLPNLLPDGKFIDNNNDEFSYTQKIEINDSLDLVMFDEQDYSENDPTIGFFIPSAETILKYTLDFSKEPDVDDLDTATIPIMNKKYYVLTNTTGGDTITLLDSAESTIIAEGETSTLTVQGKAYVCSIEYISETEVKLKVNDVLTNSLNEGQTQKVDTATGAYVGIKDIMHDSKTGAISKVEFSIGSGKLKLTNSSNIQINDNSVSELYSYINTDNTDTDSKLTSIEIEWKANQNMFVTEKKEILMPQFEAIKLSFGGLVYPLEEHIQVKQGGDRYMILDNFPLKDSEYDIPFLYGNTSDFFQGIGKDATHRLVTSNATTLNYTEAYDDYFIVSYASGDDAESYLVRPSTFTLDSGTDRVNFEYMVNGAWTNFKTSAKESSSLTLGNVEMTVGPVTSTGATTNWTVGLTLGSGTTMSFYKLYSKEGLKVYLPVNATPANGTYNTTPGYVLLDEYNVNWSTGHNGSVFYLVMEEESKDDAIGAGDQFNISIGWDSAAAGSKETEVSDLVGEEATLAEIGSTDVWRSFMYSALATEFLFDKPTSGQQSIDIIYHGQEVSAKVYLTSPDVSVVVATGNMIFTDAESASYGSKNVIVVGGSCINSAAASLVGGAYCGPSFTSATGIGAGEFLIKGYASSSVTSKHALLVAGYDAADTAHAATYLVNKDVDTSKSYKGTSATEATLVVN